MSCEQKPITVEPKVVSRRNFLKGLAGLMAGSAVGGLGRIIPEMARPCSLEISAAVLAGDNAFHRFEQEAEKLARAGRLSAAAETLALNESFPTAFVAHIQEQVTRQEQEAACMEAKNSHFLYNWFVFALGLGAAVLFWSAAEPPVKKDAVTAEEFSSHG